MKVPSVMLCKICQTRRPRRHCPGVQGDICSLCCGTEREVTVSCPLDCEFLREAHKHEKVPPPAQDYPNKDIKVSDVFLTNNKTLLYLISFTLTRACFQTDGAVDYDVREALEAAIRTYRTAKSGLIYETKPANAIAAAISEALQAGIAGIQAKVATQGSPPIPDAAILGVLVFLQQIEINNNNGRKKGRAFLGLLSSDLHGESELPEVQL